MAPNPSIVIVGAGIAGLVLAIILERAGMHRYIILERTPTLRPLGSHIALSAMMLRCFEQLGLLEEIIEVAKPSVGNVFFDEDMNYIGNLTSIFVGERYVNVNNTELFFHHFSAHSIFSCSLMEELFFFGPWYLVSATTTWF